MVTKILETAFFSVAFCQTQSVALFCWFVIFFTMWMRKTGNSCIEWFLNYMWIWVTSIHMKKIGILKGKLYKPTLTSCFMHQNPRGSWNGWNQAKYNSSKITPKRHLHWKQPERVFPPSLYKGWVKRSSLTLHFWVHHFDWLLWKGCWCRGLVTERTKFT